MMAWGMGLPRNASAIFFTWARTIPEISGSPYTRSPSETAASPCGPSTMSYE